MKFRYSYKASDDFRALGRAVQERIAKKMRFFAAQEDPLRFAKRLTDSREGEFRFRVGDYRIFFDVQKDTIFILRIKLRGKSY